MITLDTRETKPHNKNGKLRKVYYGHYEYAYHDDGFYPIIRLGGKYLAKYGFLIGDNYEVEFQRGRLIITRVNGHAKS